MLPHIAVIGAYRHVANAMPLKRIKPHDEQFRQNVEERKRVKCRARERAQCGWLEQC